MSAYDFLAEYYDVFQKDLDPRAWASFTDGIIKKHLRAKGDGEDGKVLLCDLGCGTGSVTLALTKMGYDTIGVDLSYPMLEKAREHAEEEDLSVLWIQQDITALDLYGSVDVFTSFLDTVNHITSPSRLKKCFQKVACFLNPGGLFIFDAATETHFEKTLGREFFYCIEDDFAVMWENEYLPGKKRNVASLTVFGEDADGKYERADEDIEERFYTEEEIRDLAGSCGLEVAAVYGDLKKRNPNEKDERVFYCLRRPMKRK